VVRVAIPGGVWVDGVQRTDGPLRELALRPVSGEDEAFLLDTAEHALPSERATALVARCLGDAEVETTAHALTVGDREALLLQLRALTLGDTLDCVLSCPAASCGERMELELRVAELLVPAYADVRRSYELTAEEGDARYDVSFRLPTGADLERVALVSRGDPERGADELLARCVLGAMHDGVEMRADSLPRAVRSAVAAAMAERDPQAEIELELACPTCGNAFSIVFDTATFFLQELDERARRLMHEVHTLAWHYHWSERDILQMPHRRRARYLELVSESVAHPRAR
jgi:hypothetical protein